MVRVALAVVFAVSALAKLTDRMGTRQAVAGVGVPATWVGPVASILAPAELVTALLLLPDATAGVGLALSLALLAAFTVTVILALRGGRVVECHCFGRLGGADISGRTVARNAGLALLAVAGLVGRGTDVESGPTAVALGLALAGAVVAAEALAGRAARRRRERDNEEAFDRAMEVNAAGDRHFAPDFRLTTLSGDERDLLSLLEGGLPLLLVFMMPGCAPCHAMRPAVARWADAYADVLRVAVVSRNGASENADAYAQFPRLEVLLDEDGAVIRAFGVTGTPGAALIGPAGILRGGLAIGERLVRRLLAAAVSGEEPDFADLMNETGIPADSLHLGSVVLARRTVTRHETVDGTVLVDEDTGAGATLDQIGAIVWSVLDGSPLRDIVADLAAEFETPAEVVGPDVLAMVTSLGRAGLLAGVASEPVPDEADPVTEPASTS
jgi:thiol-disulfide isomerase/thioredoxin